MCATLPRTTGWDGSRNSRRRVASTLTRVSSDHHPSQTSEILVEIVRSGFVEGHHRGSVVALTADGDVDWAIGDATSPVYPRSSNKPMQAAGMVRRGLDLPPDLLALVSASHSGEPFHIDGARRILAIAGLDESALLTPPDFPLDDEARVAFIRAGHDKEPVAMNCSGKHAGMLATCVVNGWPTDTYPALDHPLQRSLAETFAELTGETIESTGDRRLRRPAVLDIPGRAGTRVPGDPARRSGHRRGQGRRGDRVVPHLHLGHDPR